jgi:repressor LexA
MPDLSPRQQQILDFLHEHAAAHGAPPTRAEIMAAFGFASPNAAEAHLRTLARKGAIELVPGSARGIRLPQGGRDTLPVIGRVAAGSPLLAVEHVETHLPVGRTLFAPRADYLLRVRGDSMRDAGILDGDLLAVHAAREARNGQIVVARIADEVTVKRLERRGARAWLYAANPDYAPIVVDLRRQALTLEGLAVGVIRKL